MQRVTSVWSTCRQFVGQVCRDRPASHGLAHMEGVTQLAVLIHALERADAALREDLVVVAMLHDVADHKYDRDGTLEAQVRTFLRATLADKADSADLAWETISAVSYSKEKRQGMRYFEAALGPRWTAIRDIVSDADKLLAIGVDGLERCWDYQLEVAAERGQTLSPAELTDQVRQHADEKLLRLLPEYMVTPSGKFLAEPKQAAMQAVLSAWERDPPTTATFPARQH